MKGGGCWRVLGGGVGGEGGVGGFGIWRVGVPGLHHLVLLGQVDPELEAPQVPLRHPGHLTVHNAPPCCHPLHPPGPNHPLQSVNRIKRLDRCCCTDALSRAISRCMLRTTLQALSSVDGVYVTTDTSVAVPALCMTLPC